MAIRVLLADDHPVVRQALRVLLAGEGFEVAAEAADGRDAVRLAATVGADVAVFDLSMPRLTGLEAARELKEQSHAIRIVLLTRHEEPQYVTAAFGAGVHGYVLKRRAATDLVEAIHRVAAGGTYLSPDLSDAALHTTSPGRG
jgi:two-component system invasion response regulator UvrY